MFSGLDDMLNINNNVAAQGFSWTVFGFEAMEAAVHLRWMIVLCIVLILTDYWWGGSESRMRYKDAVAKGDTEGARTYKWRFSKAGRRTFNKIVDYLTYLLLGCLIGMAVTEPLGLCSHTTTSAVAMGLACLFELSSIVGHICYVHGVQPPKITWADVWSFVKRFGVNLVKSKSDTVGSALEDTINEEEEE